MSELVRKLSLQRLHGGQQKIYDNLTGRDVLQCARRFGKTRFLETVCAKRSVDGKKVGWFAPEYKYLTPSYRYLADVMAEVAANTNKSEMRIQCYGTGSIEFWTMDNENAGRGRDYDLVVIDEASLVKDLRTRWEQSISATLLDRGGDAILAGTPKGIDETNYFYLACTKRDPKNGLNWRRFHAPTSANPTLNREAVADLVNRYPALVYQQEFLAEFVDWSGAAFFSLANLLEADGNPARMPPRLDAVFMTIDSATKTGREHDGTGVIFWGVVMLPTPRLWILDWDLVQIDGDLLINWLPSVYRRGDELAKECRAARGCVGALIEDKASGMILLNQARRRGMRAMAIDSKLTAVGKDERAISVSGYVFQRTVKMTQYAYEKITNFKGNHVNHLRGQVVGFRVGVDNNYDDLLDCFCYGIAVGMGDAEGF